MSSKKGFSVKPTGKRMIQNEKKTILECNPNLGGIFYTNCRFYKKTWLPIPQNTWMAEVIAIPGSEMYMWSYQVETAWQERYDVISRQKWHQRHWLLHTMVLLSTIVFQQLLIVLSYTRHHHTLNISYMKLVRIYYFKHKTNHPMTSNRK